jgi:F0F1-type ATP synthase assembly protein I
VIHVRRRLDTGVAESLLRRVVVGVANLVLAGMLVLAVVRYQESVARVYGGRFFYVPVAMLILAGWRAAVGFLVIIGRRSGA